jgi:hypothetical protein
MHVPAQAFVWDVSAMIENNCAVIARRQRTMLCILLDKQPARQATSARHTYKCGGTGVSPPQLFAL